MELETYNDVLNAELVSLLNCGGIQRKKNSKIDIVMLSRLHNIEPIGSSIDIAERLLYTLLRKEFIESNKYIENDKRWNKILWHASKDMAKELLVPEKLLRPLYIKELQEELCLESSKILDNLATKLEVNIELISDRIKRYQLLLGAAYEPSTIK